MSGIISNLLSNQIPLVNEAKEHIKIAYKADDHPWVVGYWVEKILQLLFN